ncbi:MAG: Uma2 family endonuclease [Blastochloris sp.]|nr:Uma2 family endonuclease [Blastochloris sp.]
MSRPKPRHGAIAATLTVLIGSHVRSKTLGRIFIESGFVLARDPDVVRGPDFAFVAADRAPQGTQLDEYLNGAPDLAVEVVSPNDIATDIRRLINLYFAAGARLVWIVYPEFMLVEVHRADNTISVLHVDDELDGEDVLPGFRTPVRALFE